MGIRHEPEGAQMTRRNANPELTTSHYTRGTGAGEAINRGLCAFRNVPLDGPGCTTQPKPKETTMFRTRTTILALAISMLTISPLALCAAQAGTDTLASQVHDAAVKACAPFHAPDALPRSHYGAIEAHCIYRMSRSAMAKYEALAKAKSAEPVAVANN